MTTDASGVGAGQIVVSVHVALCALNAGMRAAQRESSAGVIKLRAGPGRGGMALLTGLGESGLHVVRIGSGLEILLVATDTGAVCGRQGVVVVHVALRALHRRVRSRERESSGGVIKGRVIPRGRRVTLLTGLRESGLHVVRISRAVEILDVARSAVGRGIHELAIDMALGAGHVGVRSRQRKLREGSVIEGCRIPCARVVAGLAGRREPRLRVRRIVGLVEVRHVAADARRRGTDKLASGMAGIAVQGSVRAH